MLQPFGTTPLPVSLDKNEGWHVIYDPLVAASVGLAVSIQQPVQQKIAAFEAERVEFAVHGAAVLAVNPHFVVYKVKNGLIRILHRHSTLRSLLRAHQGQSVTDIQFFQDGDVLATASSVTSTTTSNSNGDSKVLIWRVFERASEIMSEQLLEIRSTALTMTRVLWHPFNPNQFWMFYHSRSSNNNNTTTTTTATLVETTRIATTPDPVNHHAVADFYSETVLQAGGTVLPQTSSDLVDLAWSGRDTRYVLAGYSNGDIVLYNVKKTDSFSSSSSGSSSDKGTTVAAPAILQKVQQGAAVYRCLFLPHEQTAVPFGSPASNINAEHPQPWTTCFVTGSENNSVLTLWSPFTESSPPVKLQVLQIATPSSSYILNVCFGPAPVTAAPPACFITACGREQGSIYAFHCKATWSHDKKALLAGSDYVVPFRTKYPVLSCTVTCAPSTDISEEELSEQGGLIFDMKLFAYQTLALQCLTLTSYMCLPPASTYTDPTPGVSVRRITEITTTPNVISDLEDNDDDHYEDYDVYEDFDDQQGADDDLDDAPDPSSLPVPEGMASTTAATLNNNPFANWLGAIAAQTTAAAATTSVPPPLPLPKQPVPPVTIGTLRAPPPQLSTPFNDGTTATTSPPPPPPTPSFLSPMDLLSTTHLPVNNSSRQATPTVDNTQEAVSSKTKAKKGSSKSVKEATNNGHISILQRGGGNNSNNLTQTSVANSAPVVAVDQAAMVEEVRRIVREEIKTMVIPCVRQAVIDSTKQLTDDWMRPLQTSVDALAQQGVTTDNEKIAKAVAACVQGPLRAAYLESIKTVLIPTLESVSGQVFKQVSDHFETIDHRNDGNSNKLESISMQLTTMTAFVAELTKEVQSLRAFVATRADEEAQQQLAALPSSEPVPVVDPAAAQRAVILSLLKERKFEEAFTKAVSNPTVDMTIFCCRSAELQEILGGAQPVLSQPILLCLMQQLGTVLVTSQDPHFELEWLQEITLSLNPTDPNIFRHVPGVLQQVVTNINQRMQQSSNDPLLRRPLQRMLQVVRGMQMG